MSKEFDRTDEASSLDEVSSLTPSRPLISDGGRIAIGAAGLMGIALHGNHMTLAESAVVALDVIATVQAFPAYTRKVVAFFSRVSENQEL